MNIMILVDDSTGQIISSGYCDFPEREEGQTVYDSPENPLPYPVDKCLYDSGTNTIAENTAKIIEEHKAAVKVLANEKIIALDPSWTLENHEYKQRNALMRAVQLIRLEAKGTATAEEITELDVMEVLALDIQAIRTASNAIEAQIDIDANYDYENSLLWP